MLIKKMKNERNFDCITALTRDPKGIRYQARTMYYRTVRLNHSKSKKDAVYSDLVGGQYTANFTDSRVRIFHHFKKWKCSFTYMCNFFVHSYIIES